MSEQTLAVFQSPWASLAPEEAIAVAAADARGPPPEAMPTPEAVRELTEAFLAQQAELERYRATFAMHSQQVSSSRGTSGRASPAISLAPDPLAEWERTSVSPPHVRPPRPGGDGPILPTAKAAAAAQQATLPPTPRRRPAPQADLGAAPGGPGPSASVRADSQEVIETTPTRGTQHSSGTGKPGRRRPQDKRLTGASNETAMFGGQRAADVVENCSLVLRTRLKVFQWKKLVWQVRARLAISHYRVWRKNPRWLALMFAKEMAALWGTVGSAAQLLRGTVGPQLFM